MHTELLMNSILFHANGYQGEFIPSAFVCNHWFPQEGGVYKAQ